MSDLISRQAAIDACIRVREHRAYDEIEEIEALPTAQPMTELEAYYKGKIDGINECTERLKKLNISLQKGETDE